MSSLFAKVQQSRFTLFVWHFVAFLLLVNFLIIPHELGHLLTGLFFGAGVDAFSVGFGPEVFSFTAFDIVWRVGWIPLGGYVQFAATVEAGTGVLPLLALPAWQQVVIFSAGVFVNLLYAYIMALWLKPWQSNGVTYPLNNKGVLCIPFAINAGYGMARGFRPFMWYTACASIEIAVINMLPIVPLDGGRIMDTLLYTHLLAAGVDGIWVFLGSIVLALLVALPLLARLVRPLVNFLRYHV